MSEEQERRSSPRIEFSVQMEIRKNGDVFSGTSVNVSETGILIETNRRLDLGQTVTIHLVLPNRREVVGVGHVVRHHEFEWGGQGFAVHWALTDEQKQVLSDLIEDQIK